MSRSFLRQLFDNPIDRLVVVKQPHQVTNKESLKLYRDILKFANEFNWTNNHGQLWKDIIKKSARKEFELARHERDPMLVMKMLVTSREAMSKTRESLNVEYYKLNHTFSNRQPNNDGQQ